MISLVVSIVVALITPATNWEHLLEFYRRTQPWGFWKPVHDALCQSRPDFSKEKMFSLDMFNCAVGAVCLFSLNMMPVFFMLHNWAMFFQLLLVFLITAATMYRTWYKNLPLD